MSKKELDFINKIRVDEFGRKGVIDFTKNSRKGAIMFFVREKEKVVSIGMLLPIKINYLDKKYDILGIASIISVEKGKGYGLTLMGEIVKYIKSKRKTGLGFCGRRLLKFYERCGLKSEKRFGIRFALKDPKTGKIKFEAKNDIGDGIYYEGKDKFISKVLRTKSVGYYWVPNLKHPHW